MSRHRILAVAWALTWSGQVFASHVAIELLPQARVGAGAVVLGQVATIQGQDLDLMRALVDLPLGRAPAAGEGVVLEREALAAWVQQRLRKPATIAWSGPARSQVVTDSRPVLGEQVAAAAMGALREWLAIRSERSEVEIAWVPRAVEVPQGQVRLQPRPLGAAPVRSRMVVWVDVAADGRFVRAVPVSFSVQAWRTHATAAHDLGPRAPLEAADLLHQEVDVAKLEGSAPAFPSSGEGAWLRRAVPAGGVLRSPDLGTAPAVLRGQWASLHSGVGTVLSETRVEVLQDGRAGDSVRVRQPGAMAQVTARVLGPGQLEIAR